jgi:hypothetical protein
VLLPLPAHPFDTTLVRPVRAGKQPYVSFDRNRYSIPHDLGQRPVTLVADAPTVRVVDGPPSGPGTVAAMTPAPSSKIPRMSRR